MSRPAGLGCLDERQWEELQSLASLYEKAWRQVDPQGGSVNLEEFLPPPGAPLRTLYLHELIKADLEIRWLRHQPTCLEHYLPAFPELGAPRDLPDELIYEEYRVRQLHGDRPGLENYRARFPGQFDRLVRLVQQRSLPHMMGHSSSPVPPPPPGTVPAEGIDVGGGHVLKKFRGRGQFAEVWEAMARAKCRVPSRSSRGPPTAPRARPSGTPWS